MSVFASVFLALATVVLPLTTAGAPQHESTVYATVLDKAGVPVTTLSTTDFLVREDGVDREVLRAATATEPLRIAVLVDTSQRIDRHVSEIRGALRSFFTSMQGQHDIALYEFGERPALLVPYTRDPDLLEAGVGRVFARHGSGAYLLDAIIDAARGLRGAEGVRPVIVVITTQGPEFSNRYHETVLKELSASHATLHAFVLDRRSAFPLSDGAREREYTLAEGARVSGGRQEHLLTAMALSDRLQSLSRELKEQYRVDYARSAALIQPRTLALTVRNSRLTVRAARVPTSATGR